MARVTPIDTIKGISGKYGKDSDFYFATNTSSGKIRISRLPKPSHRPPTDKQREQRSRFAARHAAVTVWLNANKPNELNGSIGTKAYQHVQQLKRQMGLSLINQVLLKYMDENNVIKIPEMEEQRNCQDVQGQLPCRSNQENLENQGRIGGNLACIAVAVTHLSGDVNHPAVADVHAQQRHLEAANQFIHAETFRIITLESIVEHLAVDERAFVAHRDDALVSHSRAVMAITRCQDLVKYAIT